MLHSCGTACIIAASWTEMERQSRSKRLPGGSVTAVHPVRQLYHTTIVYTAHYFGTYTSLERWIIVSSSYWHILGHFM